MEKLNYLIAFVIFVAVLSSKSEAKTLPRAAINHRTIHHFLHSPLQMRERNLKREKYENTNVRKSNGHTIPIYLIMSPKASQRTVNDIPAKLENLFDSNGMIYVTNPRAVKYETLGDSVLDSRGRRTHSIRNLSKKADKALRTLMNAELNKKIVAKNTQRRLMEKYDKEYNFNDLVF